MPDKIYSLVEAFSMQPQAIHVGMMLRGGKVSYISLEGDYYMGYDLDGKKLIQVIKESVNVIYQ